MTVEERRLKRNAQVRDQYHNTLGIKEAKNTQRRERLKNDPNYRKVLNAQRRKQRQNNPENRSLTQKVNGANVKAKKFICDGKIYINDIRILMIDPFLCYYCGGMLSLEPGRGTIWEIDHKTPLTKGGFNNMDNIVAVCHRCNVAKGNQTEEEFFETIVNIYKYKGL